MHPMLREMLLEPVGWMTIIGGLIILGLPLYVALFLRKRIKEDEKRTAETSSTPRLQKS